SKKNRPSANEDRCFQLQVTDGTSRKRRLELISIPQSDSTSGAINSPTDATILLVADVFKIEKKLRSFAELHAASQADQTITRHCGVKRHVGVVVYHRDTVDGGADRKQSILHLKQCFASGDDGCRGAGRTTSSRTWSC